MGLPNAYCLKCRSYTATKSAKTVVLSNNARALQGYCGSCEGEVYRILEKNPNIVHFPSRAPIKLKNSRPDLPEAFCLKCQRHTPTDAKKTIVISNGKRALQGECSVCRSEVYRILKAKKKQARASVGSTSFAVKAIYGAVGVLGIVVASLAILRIL